MSISEDLVNEVEAINSIYGARTIRPDFEIGAPTYVLSLPGQEVSLRLCFPEGYPAIPPIIECVETVGSLPQKGAGQRILDLARQTLGEAYHEGQVCLFDLLEELGVKLEDGQEDQAVLNAQDRDQHEDSAVDTDPADAIALEKREEEAEADGSEGMGPRIASRMLGSSAATAVSPSWIMGQPSTVKKSLFIARATSVSSPEHASACIEHLLATDKRVAKATHNISAYRIQAVTVTNQAVGSKTEIKPISLQDYDDDGETAAGARLLKQMQMMEVWGVLVVVSRWYGGVKLGPARFGIVQGVAREVLVAGGWYKEKGAAKVGKG